MCSQDTVATTDFQGCKSSSLLMLDVPLEVIKSLALASQIRLWEPRMLAEASCVALDASSRSNLPPNLGAATRVVSEGHGADSLPRTVSPRVTAFVCAQPEACYASYVGHRIKVRPGWRSTSRPSNRLEHHAMAPAPPMEGFFRLARRSGHLGPRFLRLPNDGRSLVEQRPDSGADCRRNDNWLNAATTTVATDVTRDYPHKQTDCRTRNSPSGYAERFRSRPLAVAQRVPGDHLPGVRSGREGGAAG